MENVLAILLAGGTGERLYPLTRDTAKPAVPFGGAYRIIDFTLSNCINSRSGKRISDPAGRRHRRAALPPDPRHRQTGRALWGSLSDHRLHALQLHQLRRRSEERLVGK